MQFFAGDELGAIKSISYTPDESEKTWKAATTLLAPGCSSGKSKPVQKLALHRAGSDTLVPILSIHMQRFRAQLIHLKGS